MPNPAEVATIIANGITFSNWTNVTVERTMAFQSGLPVHVRVTAVEVEVHGASGDFPIGQRLALGDQAQCYLAGILVCTGQVVVRQVYFDGKSHGVEITVSSQSRRVEISTVDANPGQYLNQTLQSIGSAVFGEVGIGFNVSGAAAGANKIFPRISEQIGESRFNFIEMLCRMRNVHMLEDGSGNVSAIRSATGTLSTVLAEGVNIYRARAVMRTDDTPDVLTHVGQMNLDDTSWMQGSSSIASTSISGAALLAPVKYACEVNADNADCAMRVNHERDLTLIEQIDITITVKDWLMDDGSLWIAHVGESINVVSPLIFPDNQMMLFIKGVIHKQSNEEGTTTDVLLTNNLGDVLGVTSASSPAPPALNIG